MNCVPPASHTVNLKCAMQVGRSSWGLYGRTPWEVESQESIATIVFGSGKLRKSPISPDF